MCGLLVTAAYIVVLQRLGLYKQLFTSAYATALALQPSSITISSITCGNTSMFSNTTAAAAAAAPGNSSTPSNSTAATKFSSSNSPSRQLLAATAALQANSSATTGLQQQQQQLVQQLVKQQDEVEVPVVTLFSIQPAKGTAQQQVQLVDALSYRSGTILAGPLSKFYGFPVYSVSAEQIVEEEAEDNDAKHGAVAADKASSGSAAAAAAAGSTGAAAAPAGAAPAAAAAAIAAPLASAAGSSLAIANASSSSSSKSSSPAGLPNNSAATPSSSDATVNNSPVAAPVPISAVSAAPAKPLPSSATSGQRLAAPDAVQPVQIAVAPNHNRVRQPATKLFPWGSQELDLYEAEPACPFPPTADNSISDAQGRLWGRHSGKECVFKGAQSGSSSSSAPLAWKDAVACRAAANNANSVLDAEGKLWGWENGRSCAFRSQVLAAAGSSSSSSSRAAAKSGLPTVAVPMQVSRNANRMTVLWEDAPGCRAVPTASNTIADKFGRLWSWEDGTTCAFKVRGWCLRMD
jgi:hypothetical protein